jgi:adenylylsulfate kinase
MAKTMIDAEATATTTTTTMSTSNNDNLTWHAATVQPSERSALRGHGGAVIWLTGLSGCGKSSVANAVEVLLVRRHRIASTYILDGDNIRLGLNKNLGFSPEDRVENIRRIGETAKLFCQAGLIVLTAFISPYRSDRDTVRALISSSSAGVGEEGTEGNDESNTNTDDRSSNNQFIEVYVNASLATCEGRDPKGLYQKARAGQIPNFTGIDAPYEAPLAPELVLDADDGDQSVDDLAEQVVQYLIDHGIVPPLHRTKPALLEP